MEKTYEMLASRAIRGYELLRGRAQHPPRLVIALAGPPGSGKSTVANNVAAIVKRRCAETGSPSIAVIGMDGYHLSRAVLDTLPNREEAYIRRGAPWTFDAQGVVDLVRCCKQGLNTTIYAPTFDHALKDPVENGVVIPAGTEIVLIEGLYLLLDTEPWIHISDFVDDRWYVDVDPAIAKERVAARHVAAGIEPDLESARRRVELNDEINGYFVAGHSVRRDVVVRSLDE